MSVTQPPLGTPLNNSHPLVNGMVGYWLLNEGGGKMAKDSLGNIPVGTIGSLPTQLAKQRGQTISFPGGNGSHVTFRDSKFGGNLLTGNMTLSAWVNTSAGGGAKTIVAAYGSSASSTATYMAFNGTSLKLTGTWLNTIITTSATSLTNGTWFHVAMTRYGSTGSWTCDLYINGKLDATATTAVNPTVSTNPAGWIGALTTNVLTFIGFIQDVGMWNRALTPNEIKSLYTDPYQMFN